MEQLTKEDIQIISLYIPSKVAFGSFSKPANIRYRYRALGQIGSIIIESFNSDTRDLEDSSDIAHSGNDDRPILYKLEDMTDDECATFESLLKYDPGVRNRKELAEHILNECSPEVFLYALSHYFDLFGLIDKGHAINGNTFQ